MQPINNQSIKRGEKITFSWEKNSENERYRIVLARDRAFKKKLVDKIITVNTYQYPLQLNEGTYFWKVISAPTIRLKSIPSTISMFQVGGKNRRLPASVKKNKNRRKRTKRTKRR